MRRQREAELDEEELEEDYDEEEEEEGEGEEDDEEVRQWRPCMCVRERNVQRRLRTSLHACMQCRALDSYPADAVPLQPRRTASASDDSHVCGTGKGAPAIDSLIRVNP